jgi:hypothetical protein
MKLFKTKQTFIITTLLMGSFLFSSNISGTIRDAQSGEPLPYTSIVLTQTGKGTAADVNGYYILPDILPGQYTIKIMMIGYVTFEETIKVLESGKKFNFELHPEPIKGKEVKVSAERMRFEKRVDISRVNLTNKDIRKTTAFIESDLFRTIQLLPSVSSSNDFNAALIVRGGSPDENLILLDGTEIYNPYHIGGIFSTFNADMISDSEFLAGGFPSNYGGRLSSVLSITTREGDSKNGRLSESNPLKKYWDFSKGAGNISLLSSKIMVEGPLYNGSWMLSGRRTYFDQFVKLYYTLQDGESPFDYYFGDIHFKAKTSLNANNQLIYSQFSGSDDLYMSIGGDDFPGIRFNWDWGNATKNLTWKYIPNSTYFVNTSISQTKYIFDVDFSVSFISNDDDSTNSEDLSVKIDNLVEDFTFKQDLKYIFTDKIKFSLGWELKSLNMDYSEYFAGTETAHLYSNPSILSGYIHTVLNPIPLIHFSSGIRVSNYSKYDETIVNPSVGIKYTPHSDLALKASWGKYSQFLYTINQEEELLRIVDFWQPIPDGKKPQESTHYIIGGELWISEGNIFSIESYFKTYNHIYDLNPMVSGTDIEGTLAIPGTGEAYGLELLYRLKKDKLSGWVSYAYSHIEREVDFNSDGKIWPEQENYSAKYDKPHSFSAVLNYEFNQKYAMGSSLIFGSGQTYTPVVGKVHQSGINDFTGLDNPYYNFGNIYGAKNSARYPNYFRIDVSLSKKTNTFGLNGTWKFQIINVTNHFNVLLYNWDHESSPSKVQAYSMFPTILSFGWEFEF